MKNNYFNYLFTGIIIAITVWIFSSSSEVKIIPYLIETTDKRYLIAAIFCIFLFWLTEAFIIKAIFNLHGVEKHFFHYFKLTMIGLYYNMITPFSSGGHPAQIYSMTTEYKLPLGMSTSITMNKFMVYHICITVFALFMAIIRSTFIFQQALISKTFIFMGLTFNSVSILVIFGICYNPTLVEKILLSLLKVIKKFKLAKNIQLETISEHIDEYRRSLFTFLADKKTVLIVSLWTFGQILAYFSVSYFVYRSFGLSGASFIDILAIQSLLYMAVNFFPTPGNAGASEGGFYLIFSLVFPASVILYAIILWRLITYYFNMGAAGLVVLADHILKRMRNGIAQGDTAK